eukprot:4154138-Pyramimonas_sp.AAC.1
MLRNMLQRGASHVLRARGMHSGARSLGNTIAYDGLPRIAVHNLEVMSAASAPRLLHNLRTVDASSSAVLEQMKQMRILQQPQQVRNLGQTPQRVQWME